MNPIPHNSQGSENFHSAHNELNELDKSALMAFLKQHQPLPPAAHPDLEDSILQEINLQAPRHLTSQWRRWLTWGIASAVGVGCLASWVNQRQLQLAAQEQTNVAELAQIQDFMEQSWDGVYTRFEDEGN